MAGTKIVDQVLGSYNFTYSYLDNDYPDAPLKVEVWEEYGVLPVNTIENLTQDSVYPYTNNLGPGNYYVVFYLYIEADPIGNPGVFSWQYVDDTLLTISEYKIKAEWEWTGENTQTGDVVVSGIINKTSVTLTGTSTYTDFHQTYSYLNGNYYVNGILPVTPNQGNAWWIYNEGGTYYLMYYNTKYYTSNDLITWTEGPEALPDPSYSPAPTGTLADGNIYGIMGWGNPNGTQWSDLNGTYIKTDVAVRPSGYSDGFQGMHTPEPGTYNYYLKTSDPAFNGIAYFLAPGNRSGWGQDPNNNSNTDTPVNYWRLCVISDDPYIYFTNPSNDATTFPLTGWVPVDPFATSPLNKGSEFLPNYGGGFNPNFTFTALDSETTYEYSPTSLLLNNNVCLLSGGYTPSISYTLYNLVNGVWVEDLNGPVTYSLDSWNDNSPNLGAISLEFTPTGYPIKIVTTLRNCNEEIIHNTFQSDGLFTVSGNQTTHSESQDPASYTIRFAFEYLDPTEPNLIITPENNVRAEAYIYKNNEIIFIYDNVLPGLFYPYTFSEATLPDAEYKVVYKAINPDINLEESLEVPFTVREYKPTFDFPTISCLQINENANILLQNLKFNCFNDDENLHILPADPVNNPNIRYSLYYLNPNTYVWELQGTASDTPNLFDDAIDYADAHPTETDTLVSEYLRTKYYYGSLDTEKGLWAPEKLTMVKLVAAVTNYSTTVTKEVVFPICGSWKIRRMSCGKYRIYNYKNDVLTFTISNYDSTGVSKTIDVVPLSFQEISFDTDGIYKVSSDGLHRYIFNFCELENCVLELQKKVLLDDTLCDACKLDKVFYQKALRLIPIYETWKKLLDKDWVYEIQYQSTDIDSALVAIYDANELYAELKLLCDQCTNDSGNKKCNC